MVDNSEFKSGTMNQLITCSRCVMDQSDSTITFDRDGVCVNCRNFDQSILPNWRHGKGHHDELSKMAREIKSYGKGHKYNCIIGVSGGLDSSYAAYIAVREMGLRPLLYHVDAGWNTEQAVANIEALVDGLKVDLHTDVIDWPEMVDLQYAFLRANVTDQDMPQDVAFFSSLYRFARKNGFRYVLTGSNYSTECVREPEAWGAYPGIDKGLVYDIHARYGRRPLVKFPVSDIFEYRILNRYLYRMKVMHPLNLVPFIKADVEHILQRDLGWRPFLHKHHESRFTRFFEDYWLPRKFGFDKRRAHFSSLILTQQLSREAALSRLQRPEMSDLFWDRELNFIAKKIGMDREELDGLLSMPNASTRSFKNKHRLISFGWSLMRFLKLEKRLLR